MERQSNEGKGRPMPTNLPATLRQERGPDQNDLWQPADTL